MDCYVSLLDSDSDDESLAQLKNSVVGKVAGNEKGPTRSQEPQLVGFALGYPPTDPRSLEPQDDQSQHSAVINLDSSSNSSNSNSSSSVDAVKTSGGARDGAVLTNSRAEVKKTSELRALTEPVAVMEGTNLRGSGGGDAGSIQPAEAGRKHKSSADSDTDSEEGAPVTKKPTKSRTFRRGLSKQKSLPTAEVPVAVDTEASLVYSTRVSQCMDAMRNGRIDVPKDLVDSGSENEEGGFITREVSPPKSAHDSSRKPEHSGNPEPSGVAPRLDDSLTYANRSPSPPPTPEELLPHRAPRLNKNVKNAIKILSSVEPQTSVSDLDVSIESIESPAPDRQVVVKCRSRSGIQRFHMQTSETFRRIFREMADHEGVKETQIVMFLREQSISSMDTPASIKLHVADIIDCRIGEENRNGVESSFVDEDSFVTIIIQGQNLRSKTTVKVRKDCPLRDGMEMYCNLQGVTMAAIRFQFDGDVISPDQTPHELEMEEDDCVDAIMLQ